MGSLKLHERLTFDIAAGQVLDGPRRYVILRADVLMGAFDTLDAPTRELAIDALGRSVTRFGSDSVNAYVAELGRDELLQAIVDGSASLGWGTWRFSQDDTDLWLEVHNSPFAAGTRRSDSPACHPITGMLRAVADALWSAPADVREVSCACTRNDAQHRCVFQAVPAKV